MMHTLLISVHCLFNLLQSFKEGALGSKTITLSDTLRPTETSFFTTGQISACVYETPGSFVMQVSKVITTPMHANSDTHTLTHACLTE